MGVHEETETVYRRRPRVCRLIIFLLRLLDTEPVNPATTNGRRKARKTVSHTSSSTRTGSSCYLLGFTTVQILKVPPRAGQKKLSTKGASGSKQPLWSFSIVTTPASKDFEWLHDRQPVIFVSEDDIAKWLDPNTDKWTKELSQLVQPSETHPTLQWQATKPFLNNLLTTTQTATPYLRMWGRSATNRPHSLNRYPSARMGSWPCLPVRGPKNQNPPPQSRGGDLPLPLLRRNSRQRT